MLVCICVVPSGYGFKTVSNGRIGMINVLSRFSGKRGVLQGLVEFEVLFRKHQRRSVLHVAHRKRVRSYDVAIRHVQPA